MKTLDLLEMYCHEECRMAGKEDEDNCQAGVCPIYFAKQNLDGKWVIEEEKDEYCIWVCSKCGHVMTEVPFDSKHKPKFCPSCGADMHETWGEEVLPGSVQLHIRPRPIE